MRPKAATEPGENRYHDPAGKLWMRLRKPQHVRRGISVAKQFRARRSRGTRNFRRRCAFRPGVGCVDNYSAGHWRDSSTDPWSSDKGIRKNKYWDCFDLNRNTT